VIFKFFFFFRWRKKMKRGEKTRTFNSHSTLLSPIPVVVVPMTMTKVDSCHRLYTPGGSDKAEWAQVRSEPGGTASQLRIETEHSCLSSPGLVASSVAMCWVDFEGRLHNERTLSNLKQSGDRAVSHSHSHTEQTYMGHAFVFYLARAGAYCRPAVVSDIKSEDFLCLMQLGGSRLCPEQGGLVRDDENDKREEEEQGEAPERKTKKQKLEEPEGLTKESKMKDKESMKDDACDTSSTGDNDYQHEKSVENIETDEVEDADEGGGGCFVLSIRVSPSSVQAAASFEQPPPDEGPPVSDAHIQYQPSRLCGFTVFSVAGVLDRVPGLRASLMQDLSEVARLLPEGARRLLQRDTAFYGECPQP